MITFCFFSDKSLLEVGKYFVSLMDLRKVKMQQHFEVQMILCLRINLHFCIVILNFSGLSHHSFALQRKHLNHNIYCFTPKGEIFGFAWPGSCLTVLFVKLSEHVLSGKYRMSMYNFINRYYTSFLKIRLVCISWFDFKWIK